MERPDPQHVSITDEFLSLILAQLRGISAKLDRAVEINSPPADLIDIQEPAKAKKGAPRA